MVYNRVRQISSIEFSLSLSTIIVALKMSPLITVSHAWAMQVAGGVLFLLFAASTLIDVAVELQAL
jgi:low affinity Fe/Cu permease